MSLLYGYGALWLSKTKPSPMSCPVVACGYLWSPAVMCGHLRGVEGPLLGAGTHMIAYLGSYLADPLSKTKPSPMPYLWSPVSPVVMCGHLIGHGGGWKDPILIGSGAYILALRLTPGT